MKFGVWSYYSVDRPPVQFHRNRSSFDAPTDKYSGNSSRSKRRTFSVSGNSRRASLSSLLSVRDRLHSSLPTARSNLTSLVSPRPSLHARPQIVPNPTRGVITDGFGSSPNVYKTSPFLYLDFLVYFSRPLDFNWRDGLAPKLSLFPYIYSLV